MLEPLQLLQQYWKYNTFRVPQEEIINSVLAGRDTLALLPTGGGKSICFQLPALSKEGLCIVVSPLIALMKDQVYQLKQRNIKAAAIYAGLSYSEIDRILDNAVFGYYKLLYVSPERLVTDLFIERFKQMPINLIAVDEAHCISQWGYDFRPPYLEIASIRQYHPTIPILALTASATPQVQLDIQQKLEFKEKNVFKKSFLRDNLVFVVRHEVAKLNKLVEIINTLKGTGIVYVRNRNKTKTTSEFLKQHGIKADYYHAGLTNEDRSNKQDLWLQNQFKVIVCTNAFGMGIDKSDVRFVVHLDIPETLEAYYQEAGRAGRDGKKSYVIALYTEQDKIDLQDKINEKFPNIDTVKRVYNAICNYLEIASGSGKNKTFTFNLATFCNQFSIQANTVYHCLKFLEQANYIQLNDAVFMPSRIMFKVDKLQLYKYQVANSKQDSLIKILLRTYGGIIENYIKIDEFKIAKSLSISINELKQQLYILQKNSILHYIERSETPELFFIEERLHENSLVFNTTYINERKQIATKQLQAILNYINSTTQCRQQQICNYFGDAILPCGKCDNCLAVLHQKQQYDLIQQARITILEQLQQEPIAIAKLIPKKYFEQTTYELAIRSLLDDKLISLNEKHELYKT